MQRLWAEIPGARPLPLLIGGTGAPRRALPLIARYAQEWNGFMLDPAAYGDAVAAIDSASAAIGRDAGSIRHSLSTVFLLGRSRRELRERAMQLMNLMEGAPLLARLGWETAQRDQDEFIDVAKRHWPAVRAPPTRLSSAFVRLSTQGWSSSCSNISYSSTAWGWSSWRRR